MNFNVFVFSIIAGVFIASPAFAATVKREANGEGFHTCKGFDDPHGYCEIHSNGYGRSFGCHHGYQYAPPMCIPIGWSRDVPPTAGPCETFSDVCKIRINSTQEGFLMSCTRTYRYSIVSTVCEPWQTSKGVVVHGPCKDFINDDHGRCEIIGETSWEIHCKPDCKYVAESARCELIKPPPTDDYTYDIDWVNGVTN